MKTLCTVTLIILGINVATGQDNTSKENIERNTIYAEAFGQGFCWSLNYDRLINLDKKVINSYSIGLVYVPESIEFGDGTYYGIPVSYNWLFGKKNHHLELGLGLTSLIVNPYWNDFSTNYYVYFTPKLGYRFQRPQGGVFFRATATPMVDILNARTDKSENKTYRNFSTFNNVAGLGYAMFPWPGLSVGYTFK